MIKRVVGVAVLATIVAISSGCGESEEEKRFHQELIDKALNDDTKREGDRFLAENAKREGIVVTESGLQYEILQAAVGESPRIQDDVRVNYSSWKVDGEPFESSASQEEKPIFPIRGVIKGWREVLPKMSPGSKWKVYLPSELAYGARSPAESVPANSALIFEIELLEILPHEKADQK
ncbi:MAG: FKBP-type peptidyl-prolyl cis-trans isomerase [Amphritea sp.]|nr:FKBP-type peptidyl-prolyl cis-trans isomerase [Amphritea sp.]MBQ0784479.1 FKBP-type peptidyl-prolyl cis-trans isomerase [Amphritea sp.]